MLRKIFFAGILLFIVPGTMQAQTDTILNRYKQYLFASVDTGANIRQLAASISATTHQWNDINYSDTEPANWQPLTHLKRVRDLALAWANPKSALYHRQPVWTAINYGLNHWLEKKYKSSNWWHNEIGVPQCMRDIIILLRSDLSAQSLNKSMKVLAQYRIQNNGVGANLIWSADLGFHYAALTGNDALMQKCIDLMLKEIKITTGEGVQPDYSFHQHGARLQMYQYGKAFLWDNVRLAWQVRETKFAFPEGKIKILEEFVLNGWQWMARGIHTVPGTMDRSLSRTDELNSADIRKLIPYLTVLSQPANNQFKTTSLLQDGKISLEGYRFYPYSDFTAYQQKDFSFFLKTISSRTLVTESINNENLKGYLLNSGDAYLIRDGNEYFNLMPVWNWLHLPGITAFKGAAKINRRPFTGAVSNGRSGLTVMDYQLEDSTGQKQIFAHKSWVSHGDLVVCLIAGLSAQQVNSPVYTTLDQSRWRGKVTVNDPDNVLKAGNHQLNNVKWIHHAGFAYIPLAPATINLKLGVVSGNWKSINSSLSSQTIQDSVFMPVLNHGSTPSGLNTGYVLAYCKTAKEAEKLANRPLCNIIHNDSNCQAVQFNDGTIMAAFFSPGTMLIRNEELSVDNPCLIMISDNNIYASNPAHSAINVQLKWGNKVFGLQLNENGSSAMRKAR